ncbi:MAG: MOSC domain-containing protein, partial [Paraburkholderia tropica]
MSVIRALFVYPVKSCGAIALDQAQLETQGLAWDRHWMVVDANGRFVSQREYASMARIVPVFAQDGVQLSMDGVSGGLHLPFAPRGDEARVQATVWGDTFEALDEGDEAAHWFTRALGVPVRLVRFAHDVTRLASKKWTLDQ